MFQFDFVKYDDDELEDEIISVMANTYDEAIKKIRKIGIPNFDLTEWKFEGVYEQGAMSLNRSN